LRVAGPGAIDWWREHLARQGVSHAVPVERDGRLTLDFEDGEGQRLMLVDDGGAGEAHPWAQSPVPAEHQIRGLGPIRLSVAQIARTEAVLTEVLGMSHDRVYELPEGEVRVYRMGAGGPAAEIHLVAEPKLAPARQGAGAVHHVAFRIPDADYAAWADRLQQRRMPSSGPVDRYYFRSLYFREPNGILFEIATDGPGFATDEPLETLGERLALPPFLEGRRAEIEAGLKPL
ncbi:ring-cleaving dioxygenase, partial [Methylobacterium goesingense]